MKTVLLLLVLSSLLACGDDDVQADGGTRTDAETRDATPSRDASVDAPDTNVADVGTDAAESCEPGETRTVTCALCGTAPQTCGAAGRWEEPGDCFDQRECEEGSVDEESLAMCATRRRLCDASCMWGEWNDGQPAGVCEIGDTRVGDDGCSPSEISTDTCQADCTWDESSGCVSGCAGERRMGSLEEEVCIPAGPYIRGEEDVPGLSAVLEEEVFVSAFYIDRYPVTNRRYQECVDAGACGTNPLIDESLSDPRAADVHVRSVERSEAWQFCQWDGGRRLVTFHEWGKAARGPSPRDGLYVWDGDVPTCDEFPAPGECEPPGLVRVYDTPALRSYYGVDQLFGGGAEHVLDNDIPPVGRDSAVYVSWSSYPTFRGWSARAEYIPFRARADYYLARIVDSTLSADKSFRCARSAPGSERTWESDISEGE